MKPTAPKLIRWAGLSAMAAGIIFVVIQPTHRPGPIPQARRRPLSAALCGGGSSGGSRPTSQRTNSRKFAESDIGKVCKKLKKFQN